jgi:ketosteroid isomerase-like protein
MSQRNIDLHRRMAVAINAREVPEELLAPGFRMENRVTAAVAETYYGAAGWREWMSDLFEVFAEGARYETEEIIADGDDFVVTTLRIFGRSTHSGMPLAFRLSTVVWFHDGKASSAVAYTSLREALQAVGLHE